MGQQPPEPSQVLGLGLRARFRTSSLAICAVVCRMRSSSTRIFSMSLVMTSLVVLSKIAGVRTRATADPRARIVTPRA